MTETPQDKLTRAAALIRERAARATPGPWADYTNGHIWNVDGDCVISEQTQRDGAWVALMSPVVAPHIAAWLERSAEDYRAERKAQSKWPPGGYTMLLPDDFEAAVAFADLILASAS